MTKQDIIELKVPDIGGDTDVDVIEIQVKVGDTIAVEDSLITLESDKASMDIPATSAGVVQELKIKVGDKVSEGSSILLLALSAEQETTANTPTTNIDNDIVEQKAIQNDIANIDEKITKNNAKNTDDSSVVVNKQQQNIAANNVDNNAKNDVYATPKIRKLARELGISLHDINGSGRRGRITEKDLYAAVKNAMQNTNNFVANGTTPKGRNVDFAKFGEIEMQPLSRINKISAQNLHKNWIEIPHVTQFDEIDVTSLEELRNKHKDHAQKNGFKLTPIAFFLKACAKALQEFPRFNASLAADGENIVLKKYVHIGVAVDTENGLVVPVLRNIDQKGVFALAKELTEISVKARDGKLSGADMSGSCFAISSLGGIGGTAFTPIINAPDVAILGISRMQIRPIWCDKKQDFIPRKILTLSLSYDHRVIDGALAAKFITRLNQLLTDFSRIVL